MTENEKIEHLMKPRYKVIAEWPTMRDMALGQVITLNEGWPNPDSTYYHKWSVTDCQGTRDYITLYFKKYPHLFKPLEWWEEREASEMPDYVKDNTGEVWRVHEFGAMGTGHIMLEKNFYDYHAPYGSHSLYDLLPATETEYTQYLNGNK